MSNETVVKEQKSIKEKENNMMCTSINEREKGFVELQQFLATNYPETTEKFTELMSDTTSDEVFERIFCFIHENLNTDPEEEDIFYVLQKVFNIPNALECFLNNSIGDPYCYQFENFLDMMEYFEWEDSAIEECLDTLINKAYTEDFGEYFWKCLFRSKIYWLYTDVQEYCNQKFLDFCELENTAVLKYLNKLDLDDSIDSVLANITKFIIDKKEYFDDRDFKFLFSGEVLDILEESDKISSNEKHRYVAKEDFIEFLKENLYDFDFEEDFEDLSEEWQQALIDILNNEKMSFLIVSFNANIWLKVLMKKLSIKELNISDMVYDMISVMDERLLVAHIHDYKNEHEISDEIILKNIEKIDELFAEDSVAAAIRVFQMEAENPEIQKQKDIERFLDEMEDIRSEW